MGYFVIGPMYDWISGTDSITSSGGGTVAGFPASNLMSSNLSLRWRDASATSGLGVEWNFAGTSIDTWAVTLVGCNPATVWNRAFALKLDSVSPYVGGAGLVVDHTFANDPKTIFGLVNPGDIDRHDPKVIFGIDTLDSGGPTVDATPNVQAHKSGRLLWITLAEPHPDGYHEAAYLGIAISPLMFPPPRTLGHEQFELRAGGTGWVVTLGWEHLQEGSYTAASHTISGGVELENFIGRQRRRPCFAVVDTSGVDDVGVANDSEAGPYGRIGLCRAELLSRANYAGPLSTFVRTYSHVLQLKTWQEEPYTNP